MYQKNFIFEIESGNVPFIHARPRSSGKANIDFELLFSLNPEIELGLFEYLSFHGFDEFERRHFDEVWCVDLYSSLSSYLNFIEFFSEQSCASSMDRAIQESE